MVLIFTDGGAERSSERLSDLSKSCSWNCVVKIQTQVYFPMCLTFFNSVPSVAFPKGKCNVLRHIKSCEQDLSLEPHYLSSSPLSVTLYSQQFLTCLTALSMNTLFLPGTLLSFARLLPTQTSRFT